MHKHFDHAGSHSVHSAQTHTNTHTNKKSFEILNRERLFESVGLLWRWKCAHTDVFVYAGYDGQEVSKF